MFITALGLLLLLVSYCLQSGFSSRALENLKDFKTAVAAIPEEPPVSPAPQKPDKPNHPVYKSDRVYNRPPIIDTFPLAAAAHFVADLPPTPPWNRPPSPHILEQTPLFIGLTRN
jgi:hypothetical protein